MSIQKVSQYLLSYGSVRNASADSRPSPTPEVAAPKSSVSDDAVVVDAQLSSESSQARVARLEELKTQVQSGSYKQPDGKTLAGAVARELFM